MEEIDLRIRIPASLHKKFKIICIRKDLSVPKQLGELVRKFVEIQEENEVRLNNIKK